MKCIDDCHSYDLDYFMGGKGYIHFYEMTENGVKIDGVTNEEMLKVLIHRLDYLNNKWQGGKFNCRENSLAITKLEEALMWLEKRTANRLARNVEGTHEA
jgi:hypothetical protein